MGLPITAGCDTSWNQTRESIVTPLALRCSALDRCATREPKNNLDRHLTDLGHSIRQSLWTCRNEVFSYNTSNWVVMLWTGNYRTGNEVCYQTPAWTRLSHSIQFLLLWDWGPPKVFFPPLWVEMLSSTIPQNSLFCCGDYKTGGLCHRLVPHLTSHGLRYPIIRRLSQALSLVYSNPYTVNWGIEVP